jgi:DNA (cytosine-5)-methyltransferase 1
MVKAVPPGGNWKDIPDTVPSQRLLQIRESYKAGKGSRSTYYGRLLADAPSYTVSTYFNRPGNGCYAHFDWEGNQHRLISQREAARLQSFPDRFAFYGNKGSVNVQIGNAVPPLLAFQIARAIGKPGIFLDLFCGAGGLSLGFTWAGWRPVVANDLDNGALTTYAANVHPDVVPGDIRSQDVFGRIVEAAVSAHQMAPSSPFFVLGGPPCQGFSTAGKRRTMSDDRNRLFEKYREVLLAVQPDGFLFENVPGLLNMKEGSIFRMIMKNLTIDGYTTKLWKLHAEEFGIPQRRTRIFILGSRRGRGTVDVPQPITTQSPLFGGCYSEVISVRQALDDLPPLSPGQDGSDLDYVKGPSNSYQKFCRGQLTPSELIQSLKCGGIDDQRLRPGIVPVRVGGIGLV